MANILGTDGNDYFGRFGNSETSDTFLMGDGVDFVFGNYGADGFFGGEGVDSVSYRFALEGVTLSLALGGTGGMADGDSYNTIERIYGSDFDDSLTGDGGTNFLYGGLGNDALNGGDGADRLFGGSGTDTINGGNGNDYIDGGAGGDFINGGSGIDTVAFLSAAEGVTVNLDSPPPQAEPLDGTLSNDGQGDVYISVENISGSLFDDSLTGSFGANVITGRAGDDYIDGGAGNDQLIGGVGDDFIEGRDGADVLIGGEGADTLLGGDGNDKIYLGDGEDEAQGGEGNDFFYLTNDGDADEIYGGNNTNGDGPNTDNGFDTVSYIQATTGVEIYLGGFIPVEPPLPVEAPSPEGDLNMAVSEPDFLIGIERVIGSNFDDEIYGGFDDETIFGGDGADDFGFIIGGSDVDAIMDFEQGIDTITFLTYDETLTEADILATLVDYGPNFVFEFGFAEGAPVEQRLSVIKDDPGMVLTVDDFTIFVLNEPTEPPPFADPLSFADGLAGPSDGAFDVAFFAVDVLI